MNPISFIFSKRRAEVKKKRLLEEEKNLTELLTLNTEIKMITLRITELNKKLSDTK